jgi:hypothetical protein
VDPAGARKPVTFLIALLAAAQSRPVAGLVVGLPTLRLRGDYLAIATLGFAEIIRVAIVNLEPLARPPDSRCRSMPIPLKTAWARIHLPVDLRRGRADDADRLAAEALTKGPRGSRPCARTRSPPPPSDSTRRITKCSRL